jgi:hypothetical protein
MGQSNSPIQPDVLSDLGIEEPEEESPVDQKGGANANTHADPASASAYLFKQLDSTYGHESREMFPSKDYFRSTDMALDDEAQPGADKRKLINYDKLSKEEAVEVFHSLLSDLGVGITWKWEDVNRVVQFEERVKVLRTMADKKQAFYSY